MKLIKYSLHSVQYYHCQFVYQCLLKHDEEEEQEEEIVLNGSELTNMLQGDSSDEEASGLLHHSGADQALIAMLNLKKGK